MGSSLKSPKEAAQAIMQAWDHHVSMSTIQMERDIAAVLEERDQRIRELEAQCQDLQEQVKQLWI